MSATDRGAFSGRGGSCKYADVSIAGCSSSLMGTPAEFFEVTGWTFSPSRAIPKHSSNATQGVKGGIVGVGDSSGSVEIKVHKCNGIPFGPGATVQLLLDAGVGTDAKTLGTNYISVIAIIENADPKITIDGDGESVAMTYNFQGIRPWTGYGCFANLWETV
jgi:hypothetical protein